MNKLLSNAIFYGSAIVIGSSLGAVVAFSQLDISEQIDAIEIQIEELKNDNLGIQEISTEVKNHVENVENGEKPAKVEAKSVEKPAVSASQPSVPQVQPKPNAQEGTWVYYMDEEKYLGLCPSQRPAGSKNNISARLNSIGIISSGPNSSSGYKTLNSLIESWWDSYKRGEWNGKHMMASLNNMPEFDNTYANSRVGMFIDADGLFITWDNSWEDGKSINISEEQRQKLNKTASDGTNYLRWLDATYKAKCPND